MTGPTYGLTPAQLYMACTMRKETKGMGYPERLDASTLTQEDIDNYRASYGSTHATPNDTDLRDRVAARIRPAVFPAKHGDHVAAWITREVMKEINPALADRDARIAELEADLEVATHFLVGPYRVGRRRDHWEVWPDPSRISLHGPDAYDPQPWPTRTEALAHARHLAQEITTR